MSKDRVQRSIERLAAAVIEHHRNEDIDDRPLRARAPATQQAIAALEAHYQLPMPPLYRAFLELHDGYDWLVAPGGMFSIADQLPGPERHAEISAWKADLAANGIMDAAAAIVIAHQNRTDEFVYLDPNDPGLEGELPVVRYTHQHSSRYRDLLAFFENRVQYCRA